MRRCGYVVALAAVAFLVSGCVPSDGIAVLTQDPIDADALSSEVADSLSLDEGSARFLATVDGIDFFVATSGTAGTCLVVFPDAATASAACSPRLPITMGLPGLDAQLVADVYDGAAREGWKQVGSNLWFGN